MFISAPAPCIAIVNITGRISDVTAFTIFMALRRVEWRKSGIAALLIRICSEGGSLAAAQSICEGLQLLKEETGIITAAVVEDIAVSAAFYLALGTDFVTATPAASLGCVGAVVSSYDLNDIEARLGIRYRSVRSAPLKNELDIHGVETPGGRLALENLVGDVHGQFEEWISIRRKLAILPRNGVDGRMLSGRQALGMGLIDASGGIATALTWLAATAEIVRPEIVIIETEQPSRSVIDKILDGLPFGRLIGGIIKGLG
jgi:protease-4